MSPEIRDRVCASAAELIRKANYSGAATVEFLMNKEQEFFMLEVNTRVQVEHPVTEMITGVDIVKESIWRRSWRASFLETRGYSIEWACN